MVMWAIGVVAIVAGAMWMGSRSLMSGSNDKDLPSQDELDQMSKEELVKLGTNLDGVEIIHRAARYPEPGTGVEKRAERRVAIWLTVSGISALACFVIFLWNHWEFALPGSDEYWRYTLNTPLLGITFGLSILSIGIAVVLFTRSSSRRRSRSRTATTVRVPDRRRSTARPSSPD